MPDFVRFCIKTRYYQKKTLFKLHYYIAQIDRYFRGKVSHEHWGIHIRHLGGLKSFAPISTIFRRDIILLLQSFVPIYSVVIDF